MPWTTCGGMSKVGGSPIENRFDRYLGRYGVSVSARSQSAGTFEKGWGALWTFLAYPVICDRTFCRLLDDEDVRAPQAASSCFLLRRGDVQHHPIEAELARRNHELVVVHRFTHIAVGVLVVRREAILVLAGRCEPDDRQMLRPCVSAAGLALVDAAR